MEAKRNTPILAQRIHEAAREGRQPTTEREGPFGGSPAMHVDMGGTNKLGETLLNPLSLLQHCSVATASSSPNVPPLL